MSIPGNLGRLSAIALGAWLVVGMGLWTLGGPTRGAAVEAAIVLVLGAMLFLWWTSGRIDPASARWPLLVGVHVIAALIFGSLMITVTYLLEARAAGVSLGEAVASARFLGGEFVFWIWLYAVLGAASFGFRLRESLGREREAASRAEARLAEAQLEVLRGQLNPHFLFNALHSVTALVTIDPSRATAALEDLADLLRYSMDEAGGSTVALEEELRFTRTYLHLVEVALGDRARIDLVVAAGTPTGPVPPFSLQTLVENAIRHGVEPNPDGGDVSIRLGNLGGDIEILVENDRVPPASSNEPGRGLASLRARLAALYGDSARLEAGPTGSTGYRAQLVVPVP